MLRHVPRERRTRAAAQRHASTITPAAKAIHRAAGQHVHGGRAGGRRRHRAPRPRWRRRPSRSTVAVVRCGGHERGRTRGDGRGDRRSRDRTPTVAVGRRCRRVARVRADVLQRVVRRVLHAARDRSLRGHHWASSSRPAAPRSPPSILVASSYTMHLASRAASANRRANAVRWLAITGLMGVAFLSNQLLDYIDPPFTISSHAYGSIFYLMTGLPRPARHRWVAVHGRGRRCHRADGHRARRRTRRSRCARTTGTSSTWCGSRCS